MCIIRREMGALLDRAEVMVDLRIHHLNTLHYGHKSGSFDCNTRLYCESYTIARVIDETEKS